MEYGSSLHHTPLNDLNNKKYSLLNDAEYTEPRDRDVRAPSGNDVSASAADADTHLRLQEAIRLTTFRSEGNGAVDDVTRASEKDNLVTREKIPLTAAEAERYRVGIVAVSWASLVVLGVLGLLTFVIALREHNNASFAFGMDAILVCLSSVVLIWRYSSTQGKVSTFSEKKERISCMFLGVLFYVSATAVIIRCLVSLIHVDSPESSSLMWKIFVANCISCTLFAAIEFYLAMGLQSVSIAMDAINTALAAILSLSAFVNDIVFIFKGVAIWYIDSVIGIICGIVMIVYASWAMAHVMFHSKVDSEET